LNGVMKESRRDKFDRRPNIALAVEIHPSPGGATYRDQ
jgi:hypothetical protein